MYIYIYIYKKKTYVQSVPGVDVAYAEVALQGSH